MAYERRTWYQRLGQGLNKFLIGEKDAEGKQELTNAPDSITQQGDVISADNLNDLEGRIQAGFAELKLTKVWENPDPTADFYSLVELDSKYNEVVIEYTNNGNASSFIHVKPAGTTSNNSVSLEGHSSTESSSSGTTYVNVFLYLRRVAITNYYAKTQITFDKCREIHFSFTSGSMSSCVVNTDNGKLIPLRIYSVGNIYS